MLDIHINTKPDEDQRYNTPGDYERDKDGKLQINISKLSDERYEFLVAIHELIESELCRQRGIDVEHIDKFDINYDAQRKSDLDVSEPGDSPQAPYHREHAFATKIEKLVAEEMGVDWNIYDTEVKSLYKE